MPAPITTTLLVFGAILTALTVVGGVAVAAMGLAWELGLFYLSGSNGPRP